MGSESAAVALITAAVTLIALFIERITSRKASSRELRREGLEEWLAALARWVDDHRNATDKEAAASVSKMSQQLTNRHVNELRFMRRDRFVAWWMHEMVTALVSDQTQPQTRGHRDIVLRDTGEALVAWHHKKLKSIDFFIPYGLRAASRNLNKPVDVIAEELQLPEHIQPVRMTQKRQWRLAQLLSEPHTGRPIKLTLGPFVGLRSYVLGVSITQFKLMGFKTKYLLASGKRFRLKAKVSIYSSIINIISRLKSKRQSD